MRYSDLTGTTQEGKSSYAYDDGGRLVGIEHHTGSGAGTLIADYAYEYDLANRLVEKVENTVTTTYGYDAIGQITSNNGTPITYDGTGNRTLSGYVTADGNRMTSDGVWTYAHDLDGNVVGKSKSGTAWTYEYDLRGQLVEASDGTTTVTYAYDAFGNRIGRTEDDGTTVTEEQYVQDGWDPAKAGALGTENFDAILDLEGDGDVISRHVFGPGYDDVVARQDAVGDVDWYVADRLGSVRAVFDNSGTVTNAIGYDGFGGFLGGVPVDRYGFAGREWDAALGLQYNRARMYDPSTGRWMGEDPIRQAAGDANLYRYVGNGATNATDPSGFVNPNTGPIQQQLPPLTPEALNEIVKDAEIGAKIWKWWSSLTDAQKAEVAKELQAIAARGNRDLGERPGSDKQRAGGRLIEYVWEIQYTYIQGLALDANTRTLTKEELAKYNEFIKEYNKQVELLNKKKAELNALSRESCPNPFKSNMPLQMNEAEKKAAERFSKNNQGLRQFADAILKGLGFEYLLNAQWTGRIAIMGWVIWSSEDRPGNTAQPAKGYEELIPIYSGIVDANYHFRNGRILRGLINVGWAVSDILLLKQVAKATNVAIRTKFGTQYTDDGLRAAVGGVPLSAVPESPRALPSELGDFVVYFERKESDATFRMVREMGIGDAPAAWHYKTEKIYIDKGYWDRLTSGQKARYYWEEMAHRARDIARSPAARLRFAELYDRAGIYTFWEEFRAISAAQIGIRYSLKTALRYVSTWGVVRDIWDIGWLPLAFTSLVAYKQGCFSNKNKK